MQRRNADDPRTAADAYAEANPTRRCGEPSEVAAVAVFLLSTDAS